jgi:REP element-mobilizing transposase RayT
MTRPLRLEYPGAFYHVLNRGNNLEHLFRNKRDREKFLVLLGKAKDRFFLMIHTYCLMDNHYHLLIETKEPNLSQSIQWLNVGYATYFNRRYRRSGHLFQGRFKAILIEADEYLRPLSRYIHLNPVRAKLVSTPDLYFWSSYRALIGKTRIPQFLEVDWLLSNFGEKRKEAMQRYRAFVEGVDMTKLKNPNKEIVGSFILGRERFVNWVKETFLLGRNDTKEIPQLKQLKTRGDPRRVVDEVCKEFGCSMEQVLKKGVKRNAAREAAIYLTKELSGLTCRDLGIYFGGVSGALITMTANRIAQRQIRDQVLEERIEKIKRQIFNI